MCCCVPKPCGMDHFPASATSYSDTSQLCVLIRCKGSYLLHWCNRLVHLSKITAAAGTKTTSSCRLQLVYFRPPHPCQRKLPQLVYRRGMTLRDYATSMMKGIGNLKHTVVICKQTVFFFFFFHSPIWPNFKNMLISSSNFLGLQEQSLLCVLWYFFLLLHQHQHQHPYPRRDFNV